ncbi:hypothetical protein CPB84DRAFT_1803345 [Gymnopilus junonius]|uniref:Uncharacterized protein n=1 Tax=Gymnopilus junonius TaxID=109634 RepID=A0A9P5TEL5_GYMJU|nr:hypothetical protein CPB84DRAFT_1803345 [Gymnopilus junonius]
MTDEPQKWRIFILFLSFLQTLLRTPPSVHSSTSFFLFPCVPWDPTSSELEPGRLPESLWRHPLFLPLISTEFLSSIITLMHCPLCICKTWLFLKINFSVSFTCSFFLFFYLALTPGAFPLLRSQCCLSTRICTPTHQPPSSLFFFFSSSPTCSLIIFILLQRFQSQNTITDLYFFFQLLSLGVLSRPTLNADLTLFTATISFLVSNFQI